MRRIIVELLESYSPRTINIARFVYHVRIMNWQGERDLFVKLARRLDGKRSTAIDVGANVGILSRFFSTLFKHVHSIEAMPYLAERLTRSLPGNCIVHNIAAGFEAADFTLRVPIDERGREAHALATVSQENGLTAHKASGVREYRVKVAPLDTVLEGLSQISFVKIDVEGFENSVLQGAMNVVTKIRPVFFVEICRFHNPCFRVTLDIFRENGYKMFRYNSGHLIPAGIDDIHDQVSPFDSGARSKAYDFLYVPHEKLALMHGLVAS